MRADGAHCRVAQTELPWGKAEDRRIVQELARSPVARGLVASHSSISDAYQRTARLPTRIGSGNSPSRMYL